jgi:hypothetical protein
MWRRVVLFRYSCSERCRATPGKWGAVRPLGQIKGKGLGLKIDIEVQCINARLDTMTSTTRASQGAPLNLQGHQFVKVRDAK